MNKIWQEMEKQTLTQVLLIINIILNNLCSCQATLKSHQSFEHQAQ